MNLLIISFSDSESSHLDKIYYALAKENLNRVKLLILDNKYAKFFKDVNEKNIIRTDFENFLQKNKFKPPGNKFKPPENNFRSSNALEYNPHQKKISFIDKVHLWRLLCISSKINSPIAEESKVLILTCNLISKTFEIIRRVRALFSEIKLNILRWLKEIKLNILRWLRKSFFSRKDKYLEYLLNTFYFIEPKGIFRKKCFYEVIRVRNEMQAWQFFFKKHHIDTIIYSKDSCYYQTAIMAHSAKRCNIKTILIPYDRADSDMMYEDRIMHLDHLIKNRHEKAIKKKYPLWFKNGSSGVLSLLNCRRIYALEANNIKTKSNWEYGSNNADFVLLEDEIDFEYYLRKVKIPREKLKIIGAPYMTKMNEAILSQDSILNELRTKYQLTRDLKIIVASVTPNKFNQRYGVELEFTDYLSFLNAWARVLSSQPNSVVFFTLHPLVDRELVNDILEEHGFIPKISTESLISICDLYVVDCSATARWALYAKKQVIDYDVYKYKIKYNSFLDGISYTDQFKDFKKLISKALYLDRTKEEVSLVPFEENLNKLINLI